MSRQALEKIYKKLLKNKNLIRLKKKLKLKQK